MSVVALPTTVEALRNHLIASGRDSLERLLGLRGQDQEIIDWGETNGYEIVGFARDNATAGELPPMERPGLSAAILAVEAGQADGIVVRDFDRLARDFYAQDDALQRIWKAGGRFFTVDPNREWLPDEPWDPDWRARRDYAEEAQREKVALLRRLQNGRAQMIRRGEYAGGRPFGGRQFGYELVFIQGKRRKRPIPAEQEWIRWMIAQQQVGRPYQWIVDELTRLEIPTVTGAPWSKKTVWKAVKAGPAKPAVVANDDLPAFEWVRKAV